ncbi:putative transcriptional regulator [Pedobacter sp. AK017]|uniref:CBS domain-containing protein n=1 Tax=Pedobacter sp. AK017 TaxID=2723073 RepID=UPI001621E603|nr:CBS domain-containing protein [Pedobacter sp. AK017]MBB5436615.1 putative transcriptional regulator [Pedobacter sp. AK017]
MINSQNIYEKVLKKGIETNPNEAPVCLQSVQLACEAVTIMSNGGHDSLPVYGEGKYMGTICLKDLNQFIYASSGPQLLYHKLNFELESILYLMNKT